MWEAYLETLEDEFFTSTEARLEEIDHLPRVKSAYQGLLMNEKNCDDMKTMFQIRWESRVALGQSLGTYDQFRVVVGQFSRFSVALRLCSAPKLCRKGSLFDLVCNMSAVKAFIGFFQVSKCCWHSNEQG